MFCISPVPSFRSNAILLLLPVSKHYSTANNQTTNNFNNNNKNLGETRNTAAKKKQANIIYDQSHSRGGGVGARRSGDVTLLFTPDQSQRCFGADASLHPCTQKNSLLHRNKCCLPILTVWNGISNFPLTFRTTARFSTAMEKNGRDSAILTT